MFIQQGRLKGNAFRWPFIICITFIKNKQKNAAPRGCGAAKSQ